MLSESEEKLLCKRIEEVWEAFPFKLDYLFYKVHKDETDVMEISIEKDYSSPEAIYYLERTQVLSDWIKADYRHLPITENELLAPLEMTGKFNGTKYSPTIIDLYVDFRIAYQPGKLIARMLWGNRPRLDFNSTGRNIFLYNDLNENLPNKSYQKELKKNKL